MSEDIREQNNLQSDRREIVRNLVKMLERFVENGRSTNGKKLLNDIQNIDIWKGVSPESISRE